MLPTTFHDANHIRRCQRDTTMRNSTTECQLHHDANHTTMPTTPRCQRHSRTSQPLPFRCQVPPRLPTYNSVMPTSTTMPTGTPRCQPFTTSVRPFGPRRLIKLNQNISFRERVPERITPMICCLRENAVITDIDADRVEFVMRVEMLASSDGLALKKLWFVHF